MFSGQQLLAIEICGYFSLRIAESFEGRHRSILVCIRSGIAQSVDPIAGENRRIFLVSRLGCCDHDSPFSRQGWNRSPATACHIYDELALGGDAVQPCCELIGRNIRTWNIEFIVDPIKAAMPNQHERKGVIGTHLASKP